MVYHYWFYTYSFWCQSLVFDSITYEIRSRPILQNIYLKVEPGQVVGVFGINGSGKSTLIKIGAGFLSPTFGSVFIDGINYSYKSHTARYNLIAYLSQDSFLPKDLKVSQILTIFGISEQDDLVNTIRNQSISSLSGGEHKYLELFLILSLNRQYVLLDEPFTGVEPKYIEIMIELIKFKKSQSTGVLITDHYYRYMTEIIDTGYYLNNGNCKRMNLESGAIDSLIEEGYIKAG